MATKTITYGKQLLISLLLVSISNFAFSVNNTIYYTKIDSLIKESQKITNELNADQYCQIALYYLYEDSLLQALKYAQITEKQSILENDYRSITKQYIIKGQVYLKFGLYLKSMDNFSLAEKLGIEHNFNNLIINSNYGAGLVYNELNEYEKALEVLYRGQKIAEQQNSLRHKAIIYNAIGSALQGKGDLSESIKYFSNCYEIAIELTDTLLTIYTLNNIGESNRLQNRYNRALVYYKRANKLNNSINNALAEAAIYGNIALIYSSINDNKNAIKYYHKSINISSNNTGLSSYLKQDLKAIALVYAKQLQYDSSYIYYKKYVVFSDSLSEIDYMQRVNSLNFGHEAEDKVAQSKIISQKLYRRTIIILFITIVFLLIISILIITYSRYKLKTDKMQDKMAVLNLTLDKKNRELVANLIDQTIYTKTQNAINNILNIIDENNDTETSKKRILEVTSKLSTIEKANNTWDSFNLHFEQVHPDFFIKLNKLSSDLTTNDLRFCAFIKLKLSSQEISNILNINIRAAQATRLRIKKKLKLAHSVNLIEYIQGP